MIAASLAASTALAQETLYIGGPGGSFQKTIEEKIIPLFEAKTGAKVVYAPGSSTDTVAKLMAQKGQQDLSFILIDSGPMTNAVEQKLCAPLPNIPVLDDIYPGARLPGGTAVGYGFYATGLGYNKEVFAKNGWEAPTSWFDLGDPKYKGKVVVGIVSGYGVETLAMLAHAAGGSEKNIEPAFQFMAEKVAPNALAWEGAPATVSQMLQTGEAALVVLGNVRVQPVIDQGAPVAFVYPKEGARLGMGTACVVDGAPQPKLAAQLMEVVLSPAAQVELAKGVAFGPVNSKVELAPELAAKVVYGPEKVKALVAVDWAYINKQLPEWTQRWNREVER
ncbi:MAG: extracellular solute-binding protein [Mesorhizobium sp.]|nr:extracellular solute-binding protein [Mesorhizobium sp. M5C.F.Ca.IN.020.14.1.1]RWG50783.1 MAG: extracellular solute-binding protein [Mesorhizobium sp.]RWH55770.1 MAG: extracellular solute-binding protein [Mesorhizobium sp.]RWI67888.1 MAG: extracellular solute-binding protein [Mesorhizobium sp.]RWI77877.1 MAG: extracellular solute-binding protein [Mesorhizobium sp.]